MKKGYKAFEKGLICRGKQYAENTVFEESEAKICESGMHFCKNPLAVLDYYPLVDENGGKLTITSGKSSIMLRNGALEKFDNGVLVADKHAGTIVDFQLDLSKKIDIQSALKSLDGFDGFDIRIDDMWQDDDWLKYDVYENCSGTGTRLAGKELRNDVLNIMRKTNAPMVLDFSSVKACSSSFIDEFIAKLMVEIGPLEFNKTIKIINMNQLVSHLCERSILMRMHQSWQEIIETDEDVD